MRTLALVLDVAHIPLAIGWIGLSIWRPRIGAFVTGLIVPVQMILLGCPLTLFTSWLRGGESSSGSVTAWLYATYGPWAAAIVVLVMFVPATLVHRGLFKVAAEGQ